MRRERELVAKAAEIDVIAEGALVAVLLPEPPFFLEAESQEDLPHRLVHGHEPGGESSQPQRIEEIRANGPDRVGRDALAPLRLLTDQDADVGGAGVPVDAADA